MDAIRGAASASASIRWAAPACITGSRIAERYGIDLTIVNDHVDPTFRFMTRRLGRQDPHGPLLAVRDGQLVGKHDRFDVAFANDTDHDRHGIVRQGRG